MKKAIALMLALFCLGTWAFAAARRQGGSVPTLVWYLPTPGPTAGPDLADNLKIMSDYIEPKIGARLEIRDLKEPRDQSQNLVLNSGEYYDIMFTQAQIARQVPQGVFADITDLVPSVTPALWNYVPQMLWDGVKVKGRIYAVPSYKDVSATIFLFWDKKYVDKYKLNTSKRPYTLEDFDRDLRTVKAGEGPKFYPGGFQNQWPNLWEYDGLSAGVTYMGIRMNDPSRKVVSSLEQPEELAKIKIQRAWYKDGIIHPDIAQAASAPRGAPVNFDIAWPSKAQVSALAQGIEAYVPVDLNTPYLTTEQVRGSLQAFGVNSRYKNEALKLIELVNTDHKLRDMLAFGIEGRNFRYLSPNVVERLTDNYFTYEWAQGTFFNLSTTSDQPPTTWDEVRSQNERGVASTAMGFAMDTTSVRNEIANVNAAAARYGAELLYGDIEPEVLIPRIMAELRSLGFDKIAAEAQRQLDEYFK